MRLLIISNMAHYFRDGELVGHGPTAREISYLGQVFDEITHVGFLHLGTAPGMFMPYSTDKVRFVPLMPTGGVKLIEKLQIAKQLPSYLRVILKELPKADVVHIRAPANVSFVAMILLAFVSQPKKRWIKYAGNWKPQGTEAWTYSFQRWWLRRGWHRGVVTVNGEWPDSPAFVRSFLNPCLTESQLRNGRQSAAQKNMSDPLQIVFVGRVETAKGVGRILEVADLLYQEKIAFHIDLIGDGPEREVFEELAREKGIDIFLQFHGSLSRDEIDAYYENAHIILFPSTASEGWPKVLSEAMAYGVVAVASNISSIPYFIENAHAGKTFQADDIQSFKQQLIYYLAHPEEWKAASQNGLEFAKRFSYENYLNNVRKLLEIVEANDQSC